MTKEKPLIAMLTSILFFWGVMSFYSVLSVLYEAHEKA